MNYLEQKGILSDKANRRYYRDNNLAKYLKIDRKQCLCHQIRIGDQQLRVRYPKNMNSHYCEEYEKKRSCIGGKCEVLNRDKEKRYFKAEPILMKTTKQMDYTGEAIPCEIVKKSRPATSYGPFISSTSYGNTFQKWNVNESHVTSIIPKANLQSTTNVPFNAVSAYRDTYNGGSLTRQLNKTFENRASNLANASNTKNNNTEGNNVPGSPMDPNKVFNGKARNQKSQISILSSPGNNKTPFISNTTHRTEFWGRRSLERSHPIKHADNLGAINLAIDPKLYNSWYRNEYNKFDNPDYWKREEERVLVRRELKQLQ